MACKNCNDIVKPDCTKEVCPIEVTTNCVVLSKDIDCLEAEKGDKLTDVLKKVCELIPDAPVTTEKGLYTINSVCRQNLAVIGTLSTTDTVDISCAGTYTDIAVINGSGTNATVDFIVDGSGAVTSLSVNNKGVGYVEGDVLEIDFGCVDTIEAMVDSVLENSDTKFLNFNVTPNFTLATPTFISLASLLPTNISSRLSVQNIYTDLIPSITANTSFSFTVGIFELIGEQEGDIENYTFQLIDNEGNYSEKYSISSLNLENC